MTQTARRAGILCQPQNLYSYETRTVLQTPDPVDQALRFLYQVASHSVEERNALCRNKDLKSAFDAWIDKANKILTKDRQAAQNKVTEQRILKQKLRSTKLL